MQGIVCDVGHTIITSSVLNKLLETAGNRNAIAELYNEKHLAGLSQREIDSWVVRVTTAKIAGLIGLRTSDIEQACLEVALRAGFEAFAEDVLEARVPIVFVGAVPELVTRALLGRTVLGEREGLGVDIIGSGVTLDGDRIAGPGEICTPLIKAAKVAQWAQERDIALDETIIIGDSIGDIPTMRLTVRDNRIAIEGGSESLENMAGRRVSDFFEVSEICFSPGLITILEGNVQ
jgi:phosphoserine phosphatase